EKAINDIHKDSVEILERTGVRVHCNSALELLGNAGCTINGTVVKIPASLIEDALAQAPSKFVIYDREGTEALHLGEQKSYFGSTDGALFFDGPSTNGRRPFVLEDCKAAATIMDALPNIDFVSPFGVPDDVPAEISQIYAFENTVNYTTKPVTIGCDNVETIAGIVEIASVIRGNLEALREKPFLFPFCAHPSPLTYSESETEQILWLAERGLPVSINAAISLGATSPITLAGAVVQANAEALAGVVMSQLKRRGTPIIIGTCPGIMDMSTGNFAIEAPEHALTSAAYIEVVRHYKIPVWGNAGCTHSKIVDQQAAAEAFMGCITSSLAGADIVYDSGFLDSGMTNSISMLVMVDEILGMTKRLIRGIKVNEQTRAKSLIAKVGPGGNFLTEEHTLEHFREEFWFPSVMDRETYDKWSSGGKLTMGDRINEKTKRLLETHNPKPLQDEIKEKIKEIRKKAVQKIKPE
ncbi:MAG: trimethylamine methyltransferase family protein, partial [Spirochaetota bacterium]